MFLLGTSTRAVSAVIALCVLALPVKAEEKIWYCEMTGFAKTTLEGVETLETERFSMKVSPEEVIFGDSGFFSNLRLPMTEWQEVDYWRVDVGGIGKLFFDEGEFHLGHAIYGKEAVAISARCDDF